MRNMRDGWQTHKITDADKDRAVKRVLTSGAGKVRISQGQRRTIVASAKARNSR